MSKNREDQIHLLKSNAIQRRMLEVEISILKRDIENLNLQSINIQKSIEKASQIINDKLDKIQLFTEEMDLINFEITGN